MLYLCSVFRDIVITLRKQNFYQFVANLLLIDLVLIGISLIFK